VGVGVGVGAGAEIGVTQAAELILHIVGYLNILRGKIGGLAY
jgi:hypothetical protein